MISPSFFADLAVVLALSLVLIIAAECAAISRRL